MTVTNPKIIRDVQRRQVLVGAEDVEETYRVYALEGWIPVGHHPDAEDPKFIKLTFERSVSTRKQGRA